MRCWNIFISFILFLLPFSAGAFYQSSGGGDLRLDIFPAAPKPNDQISLRISSYLYDLDTCRLAWSEDREHRAEGTGLRTFSFQNAALGKRKEVAVSVACGDKILAKSYVFEGSEVDLLFSASTYVPPFYRGNNKGGIGSLVKVVALPDLFDPAGKKISDNELIYNWSLNGKALPSSSGYGKNSIFFELLPGGNKVSVTVASGDNRSQAAKTISIPAVSPELLLYFNRPLAGVEWQRALEGTVRLDQTESNLTLEPFYFDRRELNDNTLTFIWLINGQPAETAENSRTLILRHNNNQSGEAGLEIRPKNASPYYQPEKYLRLLFGDNRSLFNF